MSVLLVCRQKAEARGLEKLLRDMAFERITAVMSCSEARRFLQEHECRLVIINTPLSDESGFDFAADCTEISDAGVILCVAADIAEQVEDKLSDLPVFIIERPVNRQTLTQDIRFIMKSREKLKRLERETEKLQKKVDDMQVVYRAKLYLMSYLGMKEEAAHQYIQKKAMTERMSRKEVAERLIRHYELKYH